MAARVQALAIWRSRKWTVVAAVAGVAILGLCLALAPRRAAGPDPAAPQTQTLSPRPFAATLGLVGSVVPGDSIDIVAPFDGVVRRLGFEYGTSVAAGQVLVELDPGEISQRRNEAEAAYLKASKSAETLADWSSGTEVARARRAVDAAVLDLADLERRWGKPRACSIGGWWRAANMTAWSSRSGTRRWCWREPARTWPRWPPRERGPAVGWRPWNWVTPGPNLARLDGQAAGATVRAPEAGVIVRPVGKGEDAEPLHAGQAVTRGQLIGSIARAGGLAVAFQLSETDANRVRPGMAVTVTGPGFGGLTVAGHVTSVAGQAAAPAVAGGPLASFPAMARLDALTSEQAQAIRIGMTANVTVEVYRNPAALVAPAAAIQGAEPAAWVKVQDPRRRPAAHRPGQAGPDRARRRRDRLGGEGRRRAGVVGAHGRGRLPCFLNRVRPSRKKAPWRRSRQGRTGPASLG
jgi:HlyD family secretion protein